MMSSPFRETSLIMECPKCETLNYLDPFTFWNFKGKIKCAGCDAIWAYELVAGTRTGPPAAAQGPHDKMPGYAQTKDWKKITDHTKVNKGPQAREDFQGKPIPITKNKRGNPVSGAPLKPEDLIGSRAKAFAK
jgi:hypothetical protein